MTRWAYKASSDKFVCYTGAWFSKSEVEIMIIAKASWYRRMALIFNLASWTPKEVEDACDALLVTKRHGTT